MLQSLLTPISESQLKVKIIIVGDPGTGKSNIVSRFCRGSFSEYTNPTVGIQVSTRKFWAPFNLKQELYHSCLWEMSSSLEQTHYPMFFRHALGVIYVYDSTKQQTFENLKKWKRMVRKYTNSPILAEIVLGNKSDLFHFKKVDPLNAQQWGHKNSMTYFCEASALQNSKIEEAIHCLLKAIVNSFDGTVKRPIKLNRKQPVHRVCC